MVFDAVDEVADAATDRLHNPIITTNNEPCSLKQETESLHGVIQ
jgi:hypothetical protein